MALLVFACVPADNASSQRAQPVGTVRYYGFDIQRITGLLEREIDQYGCPFEIARSDFDRVILGRADQAYNPNDVRAKVVFGTETIYIDRFGVARRVGGEDFSIDKAAFAKALTATGTCN